MYVFINNPQKHSWGAGNPEAKKVKSKGVVGLQVVFSAFLIYSCILFFKSSLTFLITTKRMNE